MRFTYKSAQTEPQITGLVPDKGPVRVVPGWWSRASIFSRGARLYIGGKEASSVEWVSGQILLGTSPPGALGQCDVTVINPDAAVAVLKDGFEYCREPHKYPRIDTIIPSEGPTEGGTRLHISGRNFYDGGEEGRVRVFIGYEEARAGLEVIKGEGDADYGSGISVLTPPGEEGTRDVFVFNPDGGSYTYEGGFTYRHLEFIPTITHIEPRRGPISGGMPVLIEGTNFMEGSGSSLLAGRRRKWSASIPAG